MPEVQRLPDAETLARIRSLELHARQTVEGWLSGMHRSPQHGFAVEFAQHREYVPGDDIRHIDWKVFGRTERFYLKQYEQETNLVCYLVVDSSESMRYTSGGLSKYEYVCRAAASLAWLVLHQQDSVGLAMFDDRLRHFLRPGSQPSQLKDVVRLLVEGPFREKTSMGQVLHDLSERFTRRGIIMIFSDLLDDPETLLAGLKHLRYQRHEVVVFHVMDPAELDFPFRESTLFRGMESLPEMLTDPLSVRESYLSELKKFLEEIETGCRNHRMEYLRLRTDSDAGLMLAEYLRRRGG